MCLPNIYCVDSFTTLRRFAWIPRQARNDGGVCNAASLCGGSPGSLGVARDDEYISISFLYIKIKFCAEQNFRNYYLLSLIYYLNFPHHFDRSERQRAERRNPGVAAQ